MWFLFGLVAGVIVCSLWGRLASRAQKSEHEDQIGRISYARAEAEIAYLSVLCRELANELIRRNPDRFVELTEQIVMEVKETQRPSKEDALVRLNGMAQKYWELNAFDGVGTKNYILYEDGLAGIGDIEIEQHYRDIQIWCALNAVSNEAWRFTDECISTEKRLDEIEEYVSRYKDTLLLYQLKSAKRDYDLHRWTLSQLDEESPLVPELYDNENFEVRFIGDDGPNGTIEWAWSVKMLATGDIGCWSVFHGDDKTYVNFYTAESVAVSPNKWRPLNELHISEPRFSLFLSKPQQEF